VPYTVADAAPSAEDAGSADPSAVVIGADAGVTPAEPAVLAPVGATRWTVEGVDLVAPPDRVLVSALVRDFDDDGAKDALAIVRAPPPPGKPSEAGAAELVHYAGNAKGPPTGITLVGSPPPRTDAACAPLARLERIGPHTAFAEVGATCTRGPSSRALYVVRLARSPSVAFSLAVADPSAAQKLTIDADGGDRDHDGLDDVTLRVAIESGGPPFEPAPKLAAKLAFFDRPAGASRDAEEPDASLKGVAAQAAARAVRAKDAPTVSGLVQQMRALYRAMCSEGGAPRLVSLRTGGGGAISCGSSKPLEDAGVAETRAFVTMGDALRAITAAEAAQLPPATRTAARANELRKLVDDVAPVTPPRSARVLDVPVSWTRAPHPEWGSLGFEPSGRLLVRAGDKVMRVDPDSGEAADAEMPAWPTQVLAPDGKSRWLEATHACEGVAMRATFAPVTEGEMRDVLLPVPPPVGGRCSGGHGEPAPTIPIAWSARGLEAIVAGVPVLIRPESSVAAILASPTGEMPPLGSPRSPGGRAFAVATSAGVLVKAARAVRVKAPELEPYEDVRQCTTTDDGSRIACVKRGKVVVVNVDAQ